ncbi:hypothetical protein AB6A40_002305 [Gnathostoma spinigerum]|uniref:Ground-like domain-containing protein n=1 Tax=Gnathostoma spinigerum TaxID=75299 RepID=A0ABD6EDY1_9BILA
MQFVSSSVWICFCLSTATAQLLEDYVANSSVYGMAVFAKQTFVEASAIMNELPFGDELVPFDPPADEDSSSNRKNRHKPFPLKDCFITRFGGFICCNRDLQNIMSNIYDEWAATSNPCSIQMLTNRIQNETEDTFNRPFEMITGLADFAAKIHFTEKFMCKIQKGDRYMLTYSPKITGMETLRLDQGIQYRS